MNWFSKLKNYCDIERVDMKRDQTPITIIDIGCRWGFAEKFLDSANLGKFKIYGFDPDEVECKRLQSSYSQFPDGLITCIPKALAKSPGIRNLFVTKEPACSSFHPPIQYLVDNYPALDCISTEKIISVPVDSLSNWARESSIETLDYIKIDTQGSELEILEGAGDLLNTTRCIDIEVEFNPIYQGQSLFSETDLFLRSKGFTLWRFSNLVHYSLGGNPQALNEKNYAHFDTNLRQETEAYGGQLFWADAKYVNIDVIKQMQQKTINHRDLSLFSALNWSDIIDHMNRIVGN